MIQYTTLFMILAFHYLLDFSLQTQWQAENKSKNLKALSIHVSVYSIGWGFLSLFCLFDMDIHRTMIFTVITFILHFVTDYLTSRQSSKFFGNKDYHNGFMVIGFDQFIHYVSLFGVYELVKYVF